MARDTLFFILGLIMMYIIMMFSNYGLQLPKTPAIIKPVVVKSVPKVTPTPTAKKNTFSTVAQQYIRELWKKKTDQDIAFALVKAESNNNCDYLNTKNGTHGLFAISDDNLYRFDKKSATDCLNNIDVAKEIWDSEGWSAWTKYTNGEYKKYLPK